MTLSHTMSETGEALVRVATYSRISTDEERQPNSLEAQAVRLAAFVDSQPGWRIDRTYEDQVTGTVIDRPDLTKLLRDAKLGRFDVLLAIFDQYVNRQLGSTALAT